MEATDRNYNLIAADVCDYIWDKYGIHLDSWDADGIMVIIKDADAP